MNSKKSPPPEQDKSDKPIDPKLELSLSEIRAADFLEPPKVSLKIGESIVSTLGNITTLIGKAKSRKSFLVSIAIAVAVSKDYVFNLFTSHLPPDKQTVLLFDTEQSKYHVQLALLRVCEMVEVDEPKHLKVYGLRKYTPSDRLEMVEYAIYNTPNLGMVFIDGIKDLIHSINDEKEATMITSKLLKWTEELNISIVTVLHQNKSDTNARGHIGTELMNKSETVISVTKSDSNKEISIVNAEACRNIDFEPFGFEINEDGIPELVENYKMRTALRMDKSIVADLDDSKKYQVLTDAFISGKSFTYSKLVEQILIAYKNKIGVNRVKQFITESSKKGWLLQEKAKGPYTLGNFQNLKNNDIT